MDRVDFHVSKWGCAGSTSSPATFFSFSLNFPQQPFKGEYFFEYFFSEWLWDYVDEEMISHIVFQGSAILPDSELKSYSFIEEIIRKIFSVEWPLQKVKKKECHDGESNPRPPTSNTGEFMWSVFKALSEFSPCRRTARKRSHIRPKNVPLYEFTEDFFG